MPALTTVANTLGNIPAIGIDANNALLVVPPNIARAGAGNGKCRIQSPPIGNTGGIVPCT